MSLDFGLGFEPWPAHINLVGKYMTMQFVDLTMTVFVFDKVF